MFSNVSSTGKIRQSSTDLDAGKGSFKPFKRTIKDGALHDAQQNYIVENWYNWELFFFQVIQI